MGFVERFNKIIGSDMFLLFGALNICAGIFLNDVSTIGFGTIFSLLHFRAKTLNIKL